MSIDRMAVPIGEILCYLTVCVGVGNVSPYIFLGRDNQMAIKTRSRREKIGSGIGLVLGIIAFNLMVPLLFEKQAGFDFEQLLWAAVSAMVSSELGGRIGKWLDTREQVKGLAKEPE